MLRNILAGLFLAILAAILWFVFTVFAVIIFDNLYWCVTTCWHQSGERVAVAIVAPLMLSLFFTHAAHISLMSKIKAKNVIDKGNMNIVKHEKSNV